MEPFYQEPMAIIYNGDALKVLRALPDESIQMCITSPPYWGLRNYADGADMVWGSDGNCQHEWGDLLLSRGHPNWDTFTKKYHNPGSHKTTIGAPMKQPALKGEGQGRFCTRCFAWRGQLGLEPTPELYVEHLMMIFQEVKRVLRRDGSFYLNIGDTYFSNPSNQQGHGFGKSGAGARAAFENLGRQKRIFTNGILKPKCIVCIPERVMFAMIEDGWILRNKIAWHKPNSMPSSVKDRFTTTWEYLYFFGKNGNTILWRNRETGEWRDTKPTKEENYPWGGMYYNPETQEYCWKKTDGCVKIMPLWMGFDHYFDLDAVRKPHLSTHPSDNKERKIPFTHKGNLGHSIPWQPFNLRVRDVKRGKAGISAQGGELRASEKEIEAYEYPEKQKWEDADFRAPSFARKKHSGYFGKDGQPLVDFAQGKNPGDLWSITTHPSSISVCPNCLTVFPRLMKVCPHCKIEGIVGHFAPYPEALCVDPIKASTKPGDTVLDPLAGGGTTGVAAKRLGRKAILIDCVRAYCVMARYKLQRVEYQPELELKT